METSLLFGDFFWLAVIVIIFGGTSGIVTSNVSATISKIDDLEKKIDSLLLAQGEEGK